MKNSMNGKQANFNEMWNMYYNKATALPALYTVPQKQLSSENSDDDFFLKFT